MMKRLVWAGLIGLSLLLTIACSLRLRVPTTEIRQAIARLNEETEEELVRDAIIVTPLFTLTPTPSPSPTPTFTPTLTPTVTLSAGGQSSDQGTGDQTSGGESSPPGQGPAPANRIPPTPGPGSPFPTLTAPPLPTLLVSPSPTPPPEIPSPTPEPVTPVPPPPPPPPPANGGNGGGSAPPPLSVAFRAANFKIDESDGNASITVILNQTASQTVTVFFNTFDGTASSASDYAPASGQLTFAPGVTSRTFKVGIIDDPLIEGDETIQLELASPTIAILGTPQQAALTIVDDDQTLVNSADDLDDGFCNTAHCSLREAINVANAHPGPDTISFNIPGGGPQTINPGSVLPAITGPVKIDGTTQPGAGCASWPPTLLIQLNGSGVAGSGLVINAGNSTVRGLVINRFADNGITLQGGNNLIECNFIGTNINGTAALGNGLWGVSIANGPNNTIGGTTPAARNLISGNDNNGIDIQGAGATGNRVQGNYIGTDVTGTAALGNGLRGVSIFSSNNIIGGTASGAGNLISGNAGEGILILNNPSVTGNIVQGNFIGPDVNGATAVGNALGIRIFDATNNTIGGTTAGARNLISGNDGDGIVIEGANATGNQVRGNFIGTDVAGAAVIGNGGNGVLIQQNASNNTIGGATPEAGNRIARNSGNGVLVIAGTGNQIQANAIFNNSGLGIDLNPPGVTPNDPGDADTGANNLQNFPLLDAVTLGGGSVTITGTLNSSPNTTFRLEFFVSGACDPSGNGEGRTFLGALTATTNAAGNAAFTGTFPVAGANDQFTATATDPAGNTSEFSACQSRPSMLLVGSLNTDQVLRYDGTTGAFIDIFASGGGLNSPDGLTLGPDGNLYVSSELSNQVLRYNGASGAFIDVFASGGGLNRPTDLTFGPDGNLYVSSETTNQVLRYNGTSGAFIDIFASGGGLSFPVGLVFGPDGNLYVSSLATNQVLRYNGTSGAFIDVFASGGGLNQPTGLVFGPDGNLYVSSEATDQVLRFNGTSGAFIDIFAGGGGLNAPNILAFGPDGNLYVSSASSNQVLRYNGTSGAFIGIFASGGGLSGPRGLVFMP